jgi:hypothetical protein
LLFVTPVGAGFGAFSAPLVEFSAPTGYKWLLTRQFARDIAARRISPISGRRQILEDLQ